MFGRPWNEVATVIKVMGDGLFYPAAVDYLIGINSSNDLRVRPVMRLC